MDTHTHMPLPFLITEQMLKIGLSAVLCGAIGVERLISDKPTGLRTCMLIGTSACMFTILSVEGFAGYAQGAVVDPSRIAAQIVVGVGFLGGGSLLHVKNHVVGLTTAATIWSVSAVGMAVGAGQYSLSITMTVLTVFILLILAPMSAYIEKHWRLKANRSEKA